MNIDDLKLNLDYTDRAPRPCCDNCTKCKVRVEVVPGSRIKKTVHTCHAVENNHFEVSPYGVCRKHQQKDEYLDPLID